VAGIFLVPAEKAQDVRWEEVVGHHPPGLISGFSGGKKNINFFFGQNIARVKIVP
jgi:hypothetical protein